MLLTTEWRHAEVFLKVKFDRFLAIFVIVVIEKMALDEGYATKYTPIRSQI